MKKMYWMLLWGMAVVSMLLAGCGSEAKGGDPAAKDGGKKLVIYTSMKESLIGGIVEDFRKQHPELTVDYQSAGAGKLMEKIAAERQSGHILADIVWTSEVPDFYQMKEDGLLEQFRPAAFQEILNPFEDYDGSFTAARFGTLGIVINTDKVKEPPTSWEDIATQPLYRDSFGLADPALSGTSFMSIALLEKEFGWDYIVRLRQNGASKRKGSGQVVDNTASGELTACLGVDYITASKIEKGAHLAIKSAANMEEAKAFVAYVLSREAQQKVAEAVTVPVRQDIKFPENYRLPMPEDALKNGIHVNYAEVLRQKSETIEKFSELFK